MLAHGKDEFHECPTCALPTSRDPKSVNPKGIPQQSPGLARHAYPGNTATKRSQPQRGCGPTEIQAAATPLGLKPMFTPISQGSSFLATLGFVAESLWDSAEKKPTELVSNGQVPNGSHGTTDLPSRSPGRQKKAARTEHVLPNAGKDGVHLLLKAAWSFFPPDSI